MGHQIHSIKVKLPDWMQAEGIIMRDGAVGGEEVMPGMTPTLNAGDRLRFGDSVLNVQRDGTISLYCESQARMPKR